MENRIELRDDGLRRISSYFMLGRGPTGIGDGAELGLELYFLSLIAKENMHREAQLGQDLFALFFNDFKRQGIFIEVGANNSRDMSNTYLLENEFDWSGALVEADPRLVEGLHERSAVIFENACWSKSGESIEFECNSDACLSRVAEKKGIFSKSRKSDFNLVKAETITLDDIIQKQQYSAIDFLSIDVEGGERMVLEGLSISEVDINCVAIEHNHDAKQIAYFEKFFGNAGFKRVFAASSDFDCFFVKNQLYSDTLEAYRRGVFPKWDR